MASTKSKKKELSKTAEMNRNGATNLAKECLSSCDGSANCHVGIDIHSVLRLVKEGDFQSARDILDSENPFPSLCARLCKAGCSGKCSCAQNFRKIEQFLGDNYQPSKIKIKERKQRVAVIGAGIAGLTVSSVLRKSGLSVKVIEATDKPGGLIVKATPEFRLPSRIVQHEIMGLSEKFNIAINSIGGAMYPLEEMAGRFDAVVVACGANKPQFIGIPGEHHSNVYPALDYLQSLKKKSNDRTVVIGGGEMALDSARVAKKMGDDVTIIFHKDLERMPAGIESIKAAQQDGIRFLLLTKPVQIRGEGKNRAIECVQMMMAESDLEDANVVVPIENSEFPIPCDKVIVAVGLEPNPTMGKYTPLRTVGKGRVWTNQHMQTNAPNVFAAGEIAIGSTSIDKTIIHAKECANNVLSYLRGEIQEEE